VKQSSLACGLLALAVSVVAAVPMYSHADPLHLATFWFNGVGDPPYPGYPDQGGSFISSWEVCGHVARTLEVGLVGAGGVPPYTFHVGLNSGTPGEFNPLPAWLQFDPASGLITVSPTASNQVASLRIAVSDSDSPAGFHPTGGFASPHSGTPNFPRIRAWQMNTALMTPTSVVSGLNFNARTTFSVSGCEASDAVLWTTITTLPDQDFGQNEAPSFVSATVGGTFTASGTTVHGVNIPAGSVFWNLGSLPLAAFARETTLASAAGGLNGTRYQLQSFLSSRPNGFVSERQTVSTPVRETLVQATPAPALALIDIQGTVSGNGSRLIIPGAMLVLRVGAPDGGSNNGSPGGGNETLHQSQAWIELAPLCNLFDLDPGACIARIGPLSNNGQIDPAFDPDGGGPVLAAVWPVGAIPPGTILMLDLPFDVPADATERSPVNIRAGLDSARTNPVFSALALGVADLAPAAALDLSAPSSLDLSLGNSIDVTLEILNAGGVLLENVEIEIEWPAVQVDGQSLWPALSNLQVDMDIDVDDSQLDIGLLALVVPELPAGTNRLVSFSLSYPQCADSQVTGIQARLSSNPPSGPVSAEAEHVLTLAAMTPTANLTIAHTPTSVFPPTSKNFAFNVATGNGAPMNGGQVIIEVDSIQINGVTARPGLLAINAPPDVQVDSDEYENQGLILLGYPDLPAQTSRQVILSLEFPVPFAPGSLNHVVQGRLEGSMCSQPIEVQRSAPTTLLGTPSMSAQLQPADPSQTTPGGSVALTAQVLSSGTVPATRAYLVMPVPEKTVLTGLALEADAEGILCSAPPLDQGLPELESFGWNLALIDNHFVPALFENDQWHCPEREATTWVAFSLDSPALTPKGFWPGSPRTPHMMLRNDEVRDWPNEIDQPSPSGTSTTSRGRILAVELLSALTNSISILFEDEPDEPQADLSISLEVEPQQVQAGADETVTYSIAVSNLGPDAASNVMVIHELPGCLVLLSDNCNGQVVNDNLNWSIGSLAPGQQVGCEVNMRVKAPLGQRISHAQVAADQLDPDLANNINSAELTITGEISEGLIFHDRFECVR